MNRLLPPRRLIPRWRKARYAVLQPDMLGLVKAAPPRALKGSDAETVQYSLASWLRTGSVGDLADLLSFGVDPSLKEVLAPAARVALELKESSPAMKLVAQEILNLTESQVSALADDTPGGNARRLRAMLRNAPTDTIALVDLAQHYLANGKKKSAYRCLATALHLSPNSVYVIRAMARYWIHLDEPGVAHDFIKSTRMVGADPWLMASEIAISQVAHVPSTQLRKAQRALAIKTYSPRDMSELAAAVAGAELFSGNLKEARKLFRVALDRPTDNVLAQAIHHQGYLGIEVDDQIFKRAPNGVFEGRAYHAMLNADFSTAAKLFAEWGDEEPFSSRPRILESYVNGAIGDYLAALRAAEIGLRADLDDLMLRGNKAYALAGLRKLDEAAAELKAIKQKDTSRKYLPFTEATEGMIEILRGNTALGIAQYEVALAEFKARGDEEAVTTCYAFMARVAADSNTPEVASIIAQANERYAKKPSPAAAVILRSINQTAEQAVLEPLRKVTQWEWDPASNILRENRQLTRKGASGFVVKGSS